MDDELEGPYRLAISRFASGVTVLTTRRGDVDYGMTATAVASVSLEPLLLLASVETEARFHEAVLETGRWGVNVLAADQRKVSDWLATKGRPLHGQLDRVPHHYGEVTGVPLLDGVLASIELETADVHPAGDHSVVIGRVVAVHADEHPGQALVHYRGRYDALR